MKNGMIFPFKTTWRARLDLEYLDETSGRKIAAREGQKAEKKVDQADHTVIGKNLKQFADYASKETIGQVHAGGFLHHLIVMNPDGTRSVPGALSNIERKRRISDEWFKHLKKWHTSSKNPVIQHRLVFTMSTPFHDKLVGAGLNPDTVLQSTLKTMMRDFQEKFHPKDSIGYAYGLHHDTDNLHIHIALCPRTKNGAYVGCSKSRTRTEAFPFADGRSPTATDFGSLPVAKHVPKHPRNGGGPAQETEGLSDAESTSVHPKAAWLPKTSDQQDSWKSCHRVRSTLHPGTSGQTLPAQVGLPRRTSPLYPALRNSFPCLSQLPNPRPQ